MSLPNYPSAPTDGQEYTLPNGVIMKWDAATGVWRALANADASFRSEVAAVDSTVPIGGIQARQLRLIDGIKNLIAQPNVLMHVKGFYAGSSIGGGMFYFDPAINKSSHNGGTVIAPEALAAWDGSQANLATLLNWSGSGSGCFVLAGGDFLIENFGATTDVVDNSLAINKAAVAARNASAISATISSKIQGTVYVNDKVTLIGCNAYFPTTLFRVFAPNNFAVNDVVFDIDYTGTGFTSSRECRLSVDGDRLNPEKLLTMIQINHSQSSNSRFVFETNNCYKGLKIADDLERATIEISGYYADILCDDGSAVADGGGDENIIFVRGNSCGTWYKNHDQTSSHVTFGVEASRGQSLGLPGVDIRTGKSCALAGIIRGTYGDAIYINEGSGRNGRVHFDNLQVIQVDGGTGLKVDRISGMSGDIYIEKCRNGSVAAEIKECKETSLLRIYASEGDADCGTPVILGSETAAFPMENTSITLNINYKDASGIALRIDYVLYVNVLVLTCLGNIETTANCSRALISLGAEFLRNNRSVINNAAAGRVAVEFVGVIDFSTIATKTWYFPAITFRQVREAPTFTSAADTIEMYFKEYVDTVARFECNRVLRSSNSDLSNATKDINRYLKVRGVTVLNTNTNKLLVASGSAVTDAWMNSGTGAAEVTPV